MIYLGIGLNLNGKDNETPLQNCKKAIIELKKNINVSKISSWYKSEPVPVSNQPWFINCVVEINTNKSPLDLLDLVLSIEENFGRLRKKRNEARIIDIDIVFYNSIILDEIQIQVPHPRAHKRAFVIFPIMDLNPGFVHPILNKSLMEISKNLLNQKISKLENVGIEKIQ